MFAAFARVERTHWWFGARREIVLAVLERHVAPGGRILDVGCGTGFFLEAARERYDVWGVDPSATAIELCRRRGVTQVMEGSAAVLPVDPPFDAVLFLDVLEHLDDDRGALGEARRVLRPGGVVLATVPAYMALWSDHDVVNQHRRRYTRGALAECLRSAGLTIRQLTYYNTLLFAPAAAERLWRRATGRRSDELLHVPPPRVNRAMRRIFAAERGPLTRSPSPREFPFGLSLLAVAQAPVT